LILYRKTLQLGDMKVKFWGARGSVPTPLTTNQIQSRISAVIQRITPEDLESQETRELFLAKLPPYIMKTVGGNTTCIEIRLADDTVILFDCGTGIREFASSVAKKNDFIREYYIFFTHFHWDHVQGLPFFSPPAYHPDCSLIFHSPVKGFEKFLWEQMRYPYFPVTMEIMSAKKSFVELDEPPIRVGGAEVFWRQVKHPGKAFSYQIVENGKKFIFSTDTELTEEDFIRNDENRLFYEGADALVIDSQYTLDEALEKYDWGHSSYSLAVDFAAEWGIKKLFLFHHEPLYDDKKIFSILKSAGWYLQHIEHTGVEIHLALEGYEFEV